MQYVKHYDFARNKTLDITEYHNCVSKIEHDLPSEVRVCILVRMFI